MAGGDCDYIKSVSNLIPHFLFHSVIYFSQKKLDPLKTMITDHKNKITSLVDVQKYYIRNERKRDRERHSEYV